MEKKLAELKVVVDNIKATTDEAKIKEFKSQAVELLADIFEPEASLAVLKIEAKVETTRGHYGDYMALLGGFNGLYRAGFAKALTKAGASHEGIQGALMVL